MKMWKTMTYYYFVFGKFLFPILNLLKFILQVCITHIIQIHRIYIVYKLILCSFNGAVLFKTISN